MSVFAHCEDACGWKRMRHPIVCYIDILGVLTTVVLLVAYHSQLTSANSSLPLAIALQYVVSSLFHWLPWTEWRSKLDRSCIFLLIGATYVPYWGGLLPAHESWQRLPWVGAGALVGIGLLLSEKFLRKPELFVGLYWAAFATIGLIISTWLGELQRWLPPHALVAFWVGSACYGIQQIVYSVGSTYPSRSVTIFGFRELQHSVLYCGTTLSTLVVLTYT